MKWISSKNAVGVLLFCTLLESTAADLGAAKRRTEPAPSDVDLGNVLFRKAKFDDAERAYTAALAANPRNARALWGLGRIAELESQIGEAVQFFARAFHNAPRDPDIILSYAAYVKDPTSRMVLLQNFLNLSDPTDAVRRENVAAQLEIVAKLGERETHVISNAAAYHFSLSGFVLSTGKTQGLLLGARINGGKPLRLLLDSGAEGVYIDRRIASRLHLETLGTARIAGLGQRRAVDGQIALAETLTIGELQIENGIVRVMDMDWLSGADGVIGTSVFKDFLVQVDAQKFTLDLLPFPDTPSVSLPLYHVGHYLFVEGRANGRTEGYFLVDTGASSTVIADRAASSVIRDVLGDGVDLRDSHGQLDGATRAPATVNIGGRDFQDPHAVSLDLRELSAQTGVEVLGVLGYPMLRQSRLILNYRDGRVEFVSK